MLNAKIASSIQCVFVCVCVLCVRVRVLLFSETLVSFAVPISYGGASGSRC